jgi:4-diphosphocytidyl-2-C-methyl-D-erythritol kinase
MEQIDGQDQRRLGAGRRAASAKRASRIRKARADECPLLQAIDLASAALFVGSGLIDFGPTGQPEEPIPEAAIRKGFADGLVFVATDAADRPVGFALASERADELYLDQLSVHPASGRQGYGSALVASIIAEARRRGRRRVSLSTFRDVPWNGPFYRRLGFREIPQHRLQPWQKELAGRQAATMNPQLRCFMRKSTGTSLFRLSVERLR